MIEAVERVAAPFSLVRVDVFTNDVDFCFGEITHTPNNAAMRFIPPESEARICAIIFAEEKHDMATDTPADTRGSAPLHRP